jgi:hypothetical protein
VVELLLSSVLNGSRTVSAGLARLDRGDELAAEIGDVGHDRAPDQIAVAQGGLVHPGRPRIHQIVFDAQASGGALASTIPAEIPTRPAWQIKPTTLP